MLLPAVNNLSPFAPNDSGPLSPPPPAAPAPDAKTQTFLLLDEEGDKRTREYLRNRIDECRKEMGLTSSSARFTVSGSAFRHGASMFSSVIHSNEGSWAWQREVNQAHYDGDMDWRRDPGKETIFNKSNYTANLGSRFSRLMAAKLDGDQLPNDQFFASMPQSATQARQTVDAELAKAAEVYLQSQVNKSNLRDVLSEARQAALIRNDSTLKITWARRATMFKGPATVLVNAAAIQVGVNPDGSPAIQQIPGPAGFAPDGRAIEPGGPIRLTSGKYVYEDDDTIPDPTGQINPATGQPNDVLLKDPSFIMPPPGQAVFQSFDNLDQIEVDYEGLEAATLHFKDHIWWIRAGTLEQSDIQCHVFDESFSDLKRKYGGFATFEQYDTFMESYLSSEASRARGAQGEQEVASSRHCKGIHESYFLYDADQDGADEWVYLVYDYQNDKTIFVDYMKNHVPEPPFVMIPGLEKVEGRAYGVGVYTKLRDKSEFVDLMFNRINGKASQSSSFTIADRSAIQELMDDGELVIGSSQVYTFTEEGGRRYGENGFPVRRINLAEVGDMEYQLMETMLQTAQLEVGILTSADGSASDLNASKTATGILNNERSGDALLNKTGDVHASRFVRALEMALETILENMPPAVAFYLPGGQSLVHLNRSEIRGLKRDVRLLLTKARSGEALQRGEAATTLVLQYLQIPPATQKIVRSFFVDRLTALDVQDADAKLPDPTDEQIAAAAQAANQGASKPPAVSVSAKLGDFLPSERQQIVAKDYEITPASPQEQQVAAIQNQVQEQQQLPAHHPKPPFDAVA